MGTWNIRKSALVAVSAILAVAGCIYGQETPSATAVGPWRTGVPVTCPDGRTIPANTVISGPNVTAEELCGTNSSSSDSSSTGGVMISNTGNFKQDMLTNSVNLMIVSNTKNPIVSSFMQGAATGFISSMFASNAEAQRQQAIMAQEILRRKEEQERQRRIAEQQRLDAMYARLANHLKLEGLPFSLSVKGMSSSSPADLELKGMNSPGPGDLKLKIAESSPTGYGLKGLPGIYVGGPAEDMASANRSDTGNVSTPPGNPNLHSGPGTGTTGPGIAGLPGIYLDGVQSTQAPQLAQAAQTLSGPERDVAADTALHAAQSNPTLTAPSQDSSVQEFQQANQSYQQALAANTTASQQLETTQTHLESDKSALDVARGQLASVTPSVEQQQAFNQMLAAAKTDEEAAMLARQNFDNTQVHLSVARDRAVTALVQTASPSPTKSSSQVATVAQAAPRVDSSAVELSHVSQPATVALLRTAAPRGGPIVASPPPSRAATLPVDIDACLAAATHSSSPPATRPTAEQLRSQLEIAEQSLGRLLNTHERENKDRAEWAEEMKKGGLDIGYQAFDLTTHFVLGHYADNARQEAEWAQQGLENSQAALKTETNLARQSSLEAEIAAYGRQRADAEQAREILESTRDGAAQGATARDFRAYIKDHPIKESENGSFVPTLEGVKQLVKIGLSQESVQRTLERWATIGLKTGRILPFVDRTATVGGALIDTGYDLTVEYLGFYQLQQADQNSEQFYRGAAPLQRKIQSTVNELKCFQ